MFLILRQKEQEADMYAKRKNIRIVAGLLIVGLLVLIGQSRHLQEDYASEVFRFHVIANSDTEEDQALKLQVRDQVGIACDSKR